MYYHQKRYRLKSNFLTLALLLFIPFTALLAQNYSNFSKEFFDNQEFAHRGGYANGPENSIQTIIQNSKENMTAFEVDIRFTKDSQLIVFHDETIERILKCDKNLAVADLTLNQIKKYPFRDTLFGELYVETLESLFDSLFITLLDAQKKNFLLELDFKPHGEAGSLAVEKLLHFLDEKLEIHGEVLYNHFFISTFYPDVLKKITKRNPKIKTGFAVNNKPNKNKFLAKLAILFAPAIIKKNKVSVYEPNMCMLTPAFVKKWHKKGILLNAWTANTECEKDYLRKLNVAFTSNCPQVDCFPDESDQIGKPQKWCKKCCTNK